MKIFFFFGLETSADDADDAEASEDPEPTVSPVKPLSFSHIARCVALLYIEQSF